VGAVLNVEGGNPAGHSFSNDEKCGSPVRDGHSMIYHLLIYYIPQIHQLPFVQSILKVLQLFSSLPLEFFVSFLVTSVCKTGASVLTVPMANVVLMPNGQLILDVV